MHTGSLFVTSQTIIYFSVVVIVIVAITIWSVKADKREVKARVIALVWSIAISPLAVSVIVISLIRGENDFVLDTIMVLFPIMFYYVIVLRINFERGLMKERAEKRTAPDRQKH